jgi:hypothetical protein
MALTKVRGAGAEGLTLSTTDLKIDAGDLVFSTANKGVVIGATSNTDANTLDDFEEGTFDVTIRDATSGGNTGSVTQTNKYVKIGSFVWMQFNLINITTTGLTGGNVLYFTGLPFSPATGSYGLGSVGANQVNIGSDTYDLNIFQNNGLSYAALLVNRDNTGSESVIVSNVDNGTADIFSTIMIQV